MPFAKKKSNMFSIV